MARKPTSGAALIRMGKSYGLDKNVLFLGCVETYDALKMTERRILEELENADLIVTKEYVKGRENSCSNPLISDQTKNATQLNALYGRLLDIIQGLGKEPEVEDKFDRFLNGD